MLRIPRDPARRTPSLDGLEVTDSELRLDPARYRSFLEAVTGIDLDADLSAADCYRIGNRLEAFVEDSQRRGEWTSDLVASYPDVESRSEVLDLARVFRRCHDCHRPGATA